MSDHAQGAPDGADIMSRLLDRRLTDADLGEQTERVQRPGDAARGATRSLVFMRLGAERLAVPAADVVRIRAETPVHRIPHRSGDVLRGLCSVDGELVMTAALEALLKITGDRPEEAEPNNKRRVVVIAAERGRWAFTVDSVEGVEVIDEDALRPLPATVEQSLVHYAEALVTRDEGHATLLDPARIIAGLETTLA